jgi:hypothetical protein
MEITKESSVRRTIFYIAGTLVFLFMLFFMIVSLLSPVRKIEEIKRQYGFKQSEKVQLDERFFSDSSFISINRVKAYYQARVIMAESDSISLALNLPDSTAVLEINGVAVHKAGISDIKISKVFRKSDEYSLTAMLTNPFTIGHYYSTLRKEPLMIKMAPKDTSEYKPDILPDTTRSEFVCYMFEMENGVRLYVYQDPDEKGKGGWKLFMFDLNDRIRNMRDNLKSIIRFKVPEYHPSIRIKMKKADARIIYRALPKNGLVSVFR